MSNNEPKRDIEVQLTELDDAFDLISKTRNAVQEHGAAGDEVAAMGADLTSAQSYTELRYKISKYVHIVWM